MPGPQNEWRGPIHVDDPRGGREANDNRPHRTEKVLGPFVLSTTRTKHHLCVYRPFSVLYASKGGGPILKDQPRKWTYINGVLFHIWDRHVVFTFRRSFYR